MEIWIKYCEKSSSPSIHGMRGIWCFRLSQVEYFAQNSYDKTTWYAKLQNNTSNANYYKVHADHYEKVETIIDNMPNTGAANAASPANAANLSNNSNLQDLLQQLLIEMRFNPTFGSQVQNLKQDFEKKI